MMVLIDMQSMWVMRAKDDLCAHDGRMKSSAMCFDCEMWIQLKIPKCRQNTKIPAFSLEPIARAKRKKNSCDPHWIKAAYIYTIKDTTIIATRSFTSAYKRTSKSSSQKKSPSSSSTRITILEYCGLITQPRRTRHARRARWRVN